MPTDELYGHRLGVLLRRELDGIHAAPGLVATLRRRQIRRAWAARAAVAAPVAVAAAIAVVAATGVPGTSRHLSDGAAPSLTAGPGQPPRALTVAYVQEQTLNALGTADQYVIRSKADYGDGYYETWTDRSTQRSRTDAYTQLPTAVSPDQRAHLTAPPTLGPMRLSGSGTESGPNGNRDIVTVDYDRRTWSTYHDTEKRPEPAIPAITDADSVRQAISAGTLELLGPEAIDGRNALHLRIYVKVRGYRVDMWVDAKTYLPLQQTFSPIPGDTGGRQPTAPGSTTTYTWLPRTPENLAKLTLTPPPGFRRE